MTQARRLRALAATGSERSRTLPELPTVAESGYPGFNADAWYALLVPAGTPTAIVERLRAEVHKALSDLGSAVALLSEACLKATDEAFAEGRAGELGTTLITNLPADIRRALAGAGLRTVLGHVLIEEQLPAVANFEAHIRARLDGSRS